MPRITRQDLVVDLRETSLLVRRARHEGRAATANRELDQRIAARPDSLLAPAWTMWRVDNLLLEGLHADAITAAEDVINRYPGARFRGRSWAARALIRKTGALIHQNDLQRAIGTYRQLLREYANEVSAVEVTYQLGRLAEQSGDRQGALQAYEAAARQRVVSAGVDYADLANRNGQRLHLGAPWRRPSAATVATELCHALNRDHITALEKLASATHFRFGLTNSEPDFVDPRLVIAVLTRSRRASGAFADPQQLVSVQGGFYLPVSGWRHGQQSHSVNFLIEPSGEGWAWTGCFADNDIYRFLQGCGGDILNSAALDITIKAPWPLGIACSAGGVTGGLYYNQAPTHCGQRAFSIDFGRHLLTFGTPVLAIYQGIVTRVKSDITDNDTSNGGNEVYIDHYRDIELVLSALDKLFGDGDYTPRYSSRYLHLRGPNQIPASDGMWVEQGTKIGEMDHTGRSLAPHLHFELRDRDEVRSGSSNVTVMPSPMDDISLGINDGGTWITSTNEMVI